MAYVPPLRCFLFLLPNYINILVGFFLFALFSDEPEVFLPKYFQTAILIDLRHSLSQTKERALLYCPQGIHVEGALDENVNTIISEMIALDSVKRDTL